MIDQLVKSINDSMSLILGGIGVTTILSTFAILKKNSSIAKDENVKIIQDFKNEIIKEVTATMIEVKENVQLIVDKNIIDIKANIKNEYVDEELTSDYQNLINTAFYKDKTTPSVAVEEPKESKSFIDKIRK